MGSQRALTLSLSPNQKSIVNHLLSLCQKFVAQALKTTRSLYSQVYIIHYIDDILLAYQDEELLLTTFAYIQNTLQDYGLIITAEKVQCFPHYSYLGFFLENEWL